MIYFKVCHLTSSIMKKGLFRMCEKRCYLSNSQFFHLTYNLFLNKNVALVHISVTVLHTDIISFHRNFIFLQRYVAYLHTNVHVTFLHTAVTLLHTDVTILHNEVTSLRTNKRFLHIHILTYIYWSSVR